MKPRKEKIICIILTVMLLSGCGDSLSETGTKHHSDLTENLALAVGKTSPEEETSKTLLSEPKEISATEEKSAKTLPAKEKPEGTPVAEEKIEEASAAQDEAQELSIPQPEVQGEADADKTIYEGCYFDERWYDYVDMPAEESPLVYCEILISNVTDISFDFSVNEKVMATGEIHSVIPVGTAVIDGENAVYKDNDLTLIFTFPDDPKTFPQHLEISGLELLENNIYLNNTIPGHESG